MTIKRTLIAAVMLSAMGLPGIPLAEERTPKKFDYPTAVRADYVFACMAANGQTPNMLQKCSCSIDVIAKELPFEQYERAETIMRMQLDEGQRSAMFNNLPWMIELVDSLKRLQARSTLECF